ncbi:hypothetical protein M1N23_03590 [Dehalococcoidia bacterium]|nr:hypothetical protein [Dehalococcoidia bacterium]
MINRSVADSTLWLLAMALLLVLMGACVEESGSTDQTDGQQIVRGRIVNVDARSLLEIESLTIQDKSGSLYTVEARGVLFGEFTPSHLREHMVSGTAVEVTYYDEGGRLVLGAISDYPD